MANDNRHGTLGSFSRLTPWLLIAAAGVLAGVCIWAEKQANWYLVHGTFIGILFLLAVVGVIWWREYHLEPKVLLIAAASVLAGVCIWAEKQENWALAQGAFIGVLFLLAVAGVDWWRKHKEKRPFPPELAVLHQALEYLLLAFAVGIVAVMIVAVGAERWQRHLVAKSLGTGILFAGGVFAVGALFGFLFGFPAATGTSAPQAAGPTPRAPQQGQTIQAASGPAAPHATTGFENTNLREISDWLTKIIVGAGLVELTKLPPQVQKLAWFMAFYTDPPQLPQEQPPQAVALAILAYFSACGVLFGYVWTLFESRSTLYSPNRDAEAFERVGRWLKQSPGPNDDSDLAAMTNAIKAASAGAQMRILLDAEQHRSAGTEDAIARSLPVFQALVEADPDEVFHRNRSQYALALTGRKKDDPKASEGDWRSALDLLNDAIRIRERSREPNWHQYEFARAVCRIHLDEQFNQQQKSTPEAQSSIRADLDKSSDVSDTLKRIIDPNDPTTKEGATTTWRRINP
jgi:hypothetical protein